MTEINRYAIIRKWVLIGFLTLIALISGLAIYLNYYWKPIITERIKEAIHQSTDGLYRIDFDNVRINFVTGRMNILNIRFTPDTLVYNAMKRDSIAPRHLYKVAVAELILKRIQPWKVYFDRDLEMGSIEINHPSLELNFTDLKSNNGTLKGNRRTAYQRLAPYLKSVKIGDIIFKNADLKYIDNSLNGTNVTALKSLYIKISDLLIDSASQFDKSRLYYTRDIYAEFMGYNTITLDKNYNVQIKEFRASTAGAYVRMNGIRVVPRFGEMEFSRRFKFLKPRYTMNIEDVQLNKVDYELLNTDRRISATSLIINKANLSIFLNRQFPDSIRNKGVNFPQIALQRFKLNTTVDSVLLQNSRVDYSEYNPGSLRKGKVTFSQINGTITNLTNDSIRLIKNKYSDVKLTSLLMDRGRLDVSMNFNLNDPGGAFAFGGQLGNIDADILNSAIRPLSLIEIKSGFIDKMIFKGTGSLKGVRGKLTCYYKDLKIALLKMSGKTIRLKRKGIASIFANILIIKDDNPSPGAPVRTSNFLFNRPQHSSFFNMIWKGFAEALLETIGFDSATQKEIKVRLRKMENERIARDGRRDDRLRKRDARRSNRNGNP
ncbi:hypothetical protein [Daejeonella sp.]|uniref:hypothetical protein n=1 Tax=Daejeonella sp. TaxID=2805397 RepID=UPI0027BA7B13|nr:hypothetical protein [Daejeonella sp.]